MRTILTAVFALTVSLAAFAGEPPKQTHHCKMPDGSMDMAKTKKECKAAKGTWAKDAAAADAAGGEAKKPDAAGGEAKKPADAPAKKPADAPAK
jgi:hypothetical protein